ncbi:MAG: ATP-binding cassette domain-containing protein [Propionibacteriaceae bacterium]|nr:ATP-binding cassette domain-containing protein [Propionibacteriaceae bacterium]
MARVLTGLIKPRSGQVLLRGRPLPPLGLGGRSPEWTGVQMVFQDPGSSLNPRRRVGAQIADGIATARLRQAYQRRHRAEAADADQSADVQRAPATPERWLERIGLTARDADRFPRHFSGGQRQRIAAARALAARPTVLIADEPISALDASTQAKVAHLMCSMASDLGASLLLISHDLSIVRLVADRLIVMYQGHVVERGQTEQVWSDPLHPYTKALLGAIPAPDGAGRLPEAAGPDVAYPLEEAVRPD